MYLQSILRKILWRWFFCISSWWFCAIILFANHYSYLHATTDYLTYPASNPSPQANNRLSEITQERFCQTSQTSSYSCQFWNSKNLSWSYPTVTYHSSQKFRICFEKKESKIRIRYCPNTSIDQAILVSREVYFLSQWFHNAQKLHQYWARCDESFAQSLRSI